MSANLSFEDYLALNQLYADYASAVDSGRWELWPEFFTDDCVYRLQPRENHERGFPLATLSFTSKGMLKDRVYGIQETLFHDPYYQRHVVGSPLVRKADAGRFECEANYAVFRTKLSDLSTVFNVGRYLDTVVRTAAESWPRFFGHGLKWTNCSILAYERSSHHETIPSKPFSGLQGQGRPTSHPRR